MCANGLVKICKENTVVKVGLAFPLERKNETKRLFLLCSPVGMSAQEMTQLMRPDGKDKNRSAGTAKHFPGMTSARALCFATEHTSFSARPRAPRASHHAAAEGLAPHTSRKLRCRHEYDGSWCKGTASATIANV